MLMAREIVFAAGRLPAGPNRGSSNCQSNRPLANKEYPMCDYSLQQIRSRPAAIGEKLITHNFGTGTSGFCPADDQNTAVCLLPGTELAFERPIQASVPADKHMTAIFRQVNKTVPYTHHDALELPGGQIVMLTLLSGGQVATVLQLPAQPQTPAEMQAQARVSFVG
jgi:hypothetical protein